MKASISPKSVTLTDEDLESLPSLQITELADRLKVMRRQEKTVYFCTDYLKKVTSPKMIDDLCRTKMLAWCFQVADCGICQRQTVVTALGYLDRFLSSSTPRSIDAIESRKVYQLAFLTTLHLAIKLFEPIEIDITSLVKSSGNAFTALDIAEMEYTILSALNWRINGPTVLSFIDYFFAVLPTSLKSSDLAWKKVLQKSKQYTELTLGDYYFVTKKPSVVAIAVILNSLEHISPDLINARDRKNFLSQIANASRIDLWSKDIVLAKQHIERFPMEFSGSVDSDSIPSSPSPSSPSSSSPSIKLVESSAIIPTKLYDIP